MTTEPDVQNNTIIQFSLFHDTIQQNEQNINLIQRRQKAHLVQGRQGGGDIDLL